ncbi:MAG: SEC-C metal-binding domain-containing protein [Sphingomonas sp.]|uniref:SEC-C metal-binding domain-containing protein n=1 Tax=Sphingomonas sp. TaxID=28214 RepID=UPI00356A277C
MKRGLRFVHGDIELIEKLGRNDPCPCGSGHRFQGVLPCNGAVSMAPNAMIIIANWETGSRPCREPEKSDQLAFEP